MQNTAVKFPYWENIGRGWEDIMAIVVLLQGFFLLIPTVIIVGSVWLYFKRKTWTLKDVLKFITTKAEVFFSYMRERRKYKADIFKTMV